jgi:hypothetical protein
MWHTIRLMTHLCYALLLVTLSDRIQSNYYPQKVDVFIKPRQFRGNKRFDLTNSCRIL